MTLANILAEIDSEITRLEQAKALLAGGNTIKRGPGRPPSKAGAKAAPKRRRHLSAEGKARIAAAQKARWAKLRAKKTS